MKRLKSLLGRRLPLINAFKMLSIHACKATLPALIFWVVTIGFFHKEVYHSIPAMADWLHYATRNFAQSIFQLLWVICFMVMAVLSGWKTETKDQDHSQATRA